MDMDEILDGSEPEIVAEVIEEKEPEQVEEPKGEEVTEPPAVEESVEDLKARIEEYRLQSEAHKAQGIDERRKRQEIEREFKQSQEKKEVPDFWENPEEIITSKINEAVTRVEQQANARILNMSEARARDKYEDYPEKFQIFTQMVQRDPSVYHQMMQQPDPAEYAYRAASRLKQIQEMGDPDGYRSKVEAELRTKLEAEVRQKLESEFEEKMRETTHIPSSFSEKTSKSTPRGSFAGATSLDSILG